MLKRRNEFQGKNEQTEKRQKTRTEMKSVLKYGILIVWVSETNKCDYGRKHYTIVSFEISNTLKLNMHVTDVIFSYLIKSISKCRRRTYILRENFN